jgi:hypothetical protein
MAYRIIFEFGHENPFPRFFDPIPARLAFAKDFAEARENIRAACGKTRIADLKHEHRAEVAERRRNRRYIATIIDMGEDG